MSYSSSDFAETKACLVAEIPAKLIHQNVLVTAVDADFSAERGHGVAVVDLPSRTISVTIGHLAPGAKTRKHRHSYETIIVINQGTGFSLVEGRRIDWSAGDAVYIPVWAWHEHQNLDDGKQAVYIACENAPLLQNIGGIAVREEWCSDGN